MKHLRFAVFVLFFVTWALPSRAQVIPSITPLTFSLRSVQMQAATSVATVHYDLDGDIVSHFVPEVFECNDLFLLPLSCGPQLVRLPEDLPNGEIDGLLKDNNIRKGVIPATQQTVDLHLSINGPGDAVVDIHFDIRTGQMSAIARNGTLDPSDPTCVNTFTGWNYCWKLVVNPCGGTPSCSDGTNIVCAGAPCTGSLGSAPQCSALAGTVSCNTGYSCLVAPLTTPDDTCDHVDNNCNGQVDEGFVGSPEVINGRDDNCNGQVDEGLTPLTCAPGQADWWCCPTGEVRFAVDALADAPNESNAAAACLPIGVGAGTGCSLRGVVRRAEELRKIDGVRPECRVVAQLAPGVHELSFPALGGLVTNETSYASSHLSLAAGNLTLRGMGADPTSTVIEPREGATPLRLLRVLTPLGQKPPQLAVQNLTMRRGSAGELFQLGGGAILVSRQGPAGIPLGPLTLTVEDSIFELNQSNQEGGAIQFWDDSSQQARTDHSSMVTVRRSIFRHNQAGGFANALGGGLSVSSSTLLVEDSAFVGNVGTRGGGLWVQDTDLTALNSTFGENVADFDGGGIHADTFLSASAVAFLRFNTIANNNASPSLGSQEGPGLRVGTGVNLVAFGNIIAGNTFGLFRMTQSPDCAIEGHIAAIGHNLVGAGGLDCAGLGTPGVDPLIGSVAAPLKAELDRLPETPPPGKFFANVCPAGIKSLELNFPACDVICKPVNGIGCVYALGTMPQSPATSAFGFAAPAVDAVNACPAHDQRQLPRPAVPSTVNCSIGAYEARGVSNADFDFIDPQIDSLPGQFSSEFNDDLLFGVTSGRIVDRAGQTVFVRDAVGLQKGVEIGVLASTLPGTVVIKACNDTMELRLTQGQVTTLTCPTTHSRFYSQFGAVVGHEADLFGDFFSGQFALGNGVHLEGNLTSIAGGSLGSNSVIRGNATTHGTLDGNRGGVLGRLVEHANVDPQSIFIHSGGSVSDDTLTVHDTMSGADAALPPGDYGAVTIDAGATLQLGPGLYRMTTLTAGADVTLESFANGEATVIAVDHDLVVGNRFKTRAANGGSNQATRFLVYTNGTAIQLGHDFSLQGSLESPFGQTVIGNNAFFRDGLAASVLNVGHKAVIGSGLAAPCGSLPIVPASATASSSESSTFAASKAIDGNTATRWSSAFSDPQWIMLDLGTTQLVNRVVLNWEAAFSRNFSIQIAPSASGPWTTLYKNAAGDGGIDDLTGLQGTGRYVRMLSTARGTQWGNSLFEMQVFGDSNAACAGPIQLTAVTAVSSSNESSSFAAAKAIDGDANTRWSSSFSNPQSIYLDLGATRTIQRVVLDWEVAFSTQYDIQVSDNPATGWTTIHTNDAGNGGVDDITGLDAHGRYVRMLGRAKATPYGHSLWEFQVYGVP